QVLMQNFNQARQEQWQLVLPAVAQEVVTPLSEVLYLEAGQEQCIFHLRKGSPITAERPFRYYLDLLGNMPFFQINNTQMVHLKAVLQLSADKLQVVLPNNIRLDMTERRRKEFLSKWK
ncbi:MAG TPA: LytTR family transcriptional regulator DNA-binding domain-containing protein, partial [Chitinophaga sp.]